LVVLDDEHRVVRTVVQGRTVHDAADPDPDLSTRERNAS
jgi:hypothetical protein